MKRQFVPQIEIKKRHPRGMTSYTDGDYANFAALLMEELKKVGIKDLTSDELKEIALNLTMYYEDVMADAGIWRGFTNKVHEMYGRYLPFYDLDEDVYMRDEPNIEDLQFIIWNTLTTIRFSKGRITNPETPAATKMAKVAYELMYKWFEEIPVNEELKAFFEEAKFMDNFYEQREVLKWISFYCYLTYIPNYTDEIEDHAHYVSKILDATDDLGSYIAECELPYTHKMGPLALSAPEWLGIILRANGQKEKALDAERQEQKPFDLFKIQKAEAGKGVEFADTMGETFYVTDDGLRNPSSISYTCNTAIGAFVKYRDAWYLNASICWSDRGEGLYKLAKEHVEKQKQRTDFDYDKLMAASGGSPFFYFENYQETIDFLVKEGGMSREALSEYDIPKKGTHILLVVKGKGNLVFQFDMKSECCLKDVRNPYYDEKIAKGNSLVAALELPIGALKYAMDHDMIPHAGLNSIYGEERGKALFRENYDFIARAALRNDYE